MALAAACAIAAAHATAAMTPDPTGLWYDPAESGWGIALAQQGDTAFAVLFVYDPASHPAWYFASDLATPETFGPVPGGPGLSGTLYRAMGPWFGGAFDPRAVTPTAVGSLSLQYTDANHRSLRVDYVIDGTTFTKLVQAQTWRDDFARLLPGTYEGGMWLTGKSATNCEDALSLIHI